MCRELTQSDDQSYIALARKVHDHGKESTADLMVDIKSAILDQHIPALRDIDATQQQQGNYGVYNNCGEATAFSRL